MTLNNYFDVKKDALRTFSDNVNNISVMLPQLLLVLLVIKTGGVWETHWQTLLLKVSSHDMKLGYPGDLPEKPLRLMTGVITTFKVMEMFKVLVDCIQMKHIQSNLPMLSPPLSSHLY
jgi:hypothetical protein